MNMNNNTIAIIIVNDIKMHPVAEFRRGIMRLPFAAITSWSPLSKVYYQSVPPENLKYRAGYQSVSCVGGGDSKALVGNPP